MTELWKDFREIDQRGWFGIAMVGLGNACLVLTGLVGNSVVSLVVLALLSFAWVVLLQLTRVIMNGSLSLAQETTVLWQNEIDFTQELVEDYVSTISDLKRYDLQASGVHLERLRTMLIKRRPDMEEEIMRVEHPLNMTGIVI